MATEVYRQIIGTGRGHENLDMPMRNDGGVGGSEILGASHMQDIEQ
jgi:hypothetical protein